MKEELLGNIYLHEGRTGCWWQEEESVKSLALERARRSATGFAGSSRIVVFYLYPIVDLPLPLLSVLHSLWTLLTNMPMMATRIPATPQATTCLHIFANGFKALEIENPRHGESAYVRAFICMPY